MARAVLRKDLPLHRDASARFLPWLIALMVYLAAVALAAALAVQQITVRWDQGLSDRATVQVPPPATQSEETLQSRIDAVVGMLRETDGVRDVRVMGEEEIARLIEPWLGQADALEDLPLPALITVRLERGADVDLQGLEDRLSARVPGAILDDHRQWIADLLEFSSTVQILAALIVLLVGAAAVASVIFVTRTGLAIHHRVIEVLHLIGAQDSYVARQFQNHALRLGLKGGFAGLALALLTILSIQHLISGGGAGLLPEISLGPASWTLMALLPVLTAIVAMLTARWTVLRTLARMA
jgi:cell division transport system permease protein